jgi:hypothetical protein
MLDSICEIPVYCRPGGAGRDAGEVAARVLVDEDDWLRFARFRWRLHDGYAISTGSRRNPIGEPERHYFLHRLILGLDHGDKRRADHRNRDRLDCRRANLRIVTQAQNNQNVTASGAVPYRGVCLHTPSGRYFARVTIDGRTHSLGYHRTPLEAAAAAEAFRAEHMPFSEEATDA